MPRLPVLPVLGRPAGPGRGGGVAGRSLTRVPGAGYADGPPNRIRRAVLAALLPAMTYGSPASAQALFHPDDTLDGVRARARAVPCRAGDGWRPSRVVARSAETSGVAEAVLYVAAVDPERVQPGMDPERLPLVPYLRVLGEPVSDLLSLRSFRQPRTIRFVTSLTVSAPVFPPGTPATLVGRFTLRDGSTRWVRLAEAPPVGCVAWTVSVARGTVGDDTRSPRPDPP